MARGFKNFVYFKTVAYHRAGKLNLPVPNISLVQLFGNLPAAPSMPFWPKSTSNGWLQQLDKIRHRNFECGYLANLKLAAETAKELALEKAELQRFSKIGRPSLS